MRASVKVMLLAVVFLLSTLSVGQECEAPKTSSVEKLTDYLQHAGDSAEVAPCVQAAFRRIAALPSEQAIPLLITYLGYKRPLNESERHGFFMHAKAPDVLYPAVQELFVIGGPAEPAVIGFIAKNKDGVGQESKNAVYTLLLIRHGDVVSVIQELHRAGQSSADSEARDRLQLAAQDALKWCDERSQTECEDALK
jgi:hypothetical protein